MSLQTFRLKVKALAILHMSLCNSARRFVLNHVVAHPRPQQAIQQMELKRLGQLAKVSRLDSPASKRRQEVQERGSLPRRIGPRNQASQRACSDRAQAREGGHEGYSGRQKKEGHQTSGCPQAQIFPWRGSELPCACLGRGHFEASSGSEITAVSGKGSRRRNSCIGGGESPPQQSNQALTDSHRVKRGCRVGSAEAHRRVAVSSSCRCKSKSVSLRDNSGTANGKPFFLRCAAQQLLQRMGDALWKPSSWSKFPTS